MKPLDYKRKDRPSSEIDYSELYSQGNGGDYGGELDIQNVYQNQMRLIRFDELTDEPIKCKACGGNAWHNKIRIAKSYRKIYCMCGHIQKIYSEGEVIVK